MPTLGPIAIKTHADNYIWIKITTDANANLLSYFEATDFTNNQWSEQPIAQLQTTLISYNQVEKQSFCMTIKKVGDNYRAYRFLFRKLNEEFFPLPHGEIYTITDQETSSWTPDLAEKSRGIITSDDYWLISETIAKLVHQEYVAWTKVVDPKWHQGENCSPLDLAKLNEAILTSSLTNYQRAQIRNTVCYDWETLKEESKDSNEYCQALSLIMTGELSENLMQEMQFSIQTQSNAPAVRFHLLSSTFDKYGNTFYSELEGRNSTIAHMHTYLIALMQQEINQY